MEKIENKLEDIQGDVKQLQHQQHQRQQQLYEAEAGIVRSFSGVDDVGNEEGFTISNCRRQLQPRHHEKMNVTPIKNAWSEFHDDDPSAGEDSEGPEALTPEKVKEKKMAVNQSDRDLLCVKSGSAAIDHDGRELETLLDVFQILPDDKYGAAEFPFIRRKRKKTKALKR